MAAPRVRRELGVILAAEEPRVIGELDHLAQVAGQRAFCSRTDDESRGLEPRQVMIIDLVAMAMPLGHRGRSVNAIRERSRNDFTRLRTQAHRSAQIGPRGWRLDRTVAVLPLGDERYDRVRRVGIELRTVRVGEPRLVSGVLDDGELHAEADTEIWDAGLARVADRLDLAFHATLAKPAGDEDRVHAL